jgi:predicted nucleic acid-binding protein
MILLDTNVVVYTLDRSAPQHQECRRLLDLVQAGRVAAALLPQVIVECYSVLTSARRVAAPLPAEQARAALGALRRVLDVKPVPAGALPELDRLLARHPRLGADVFDLFLAAQMRCHGIEDICTYNVADFVLPGIRALTPSQVLATGQRG